MKVKFNYGKELELREKQTSSFDISYAGMIGEDGKYYICLTDYKTHKHYCVQKGNHIEYDEKNVLTIFDEPRIICGNLVRAMTPEEERLWNEDRLLAVVDVFGNVSVTEEFDMDWYMNNCI